MKKYLVHSLALVTFLLTLALPAQAADLTLYAGRLNPGNLTFNNLQTSLEGSMIYGLRFGGTFGRVFGVEQMISYSHDFLEPEIIGTRQDAHGLLYATNFLVNVPLGHVVPYATVGVGAISHLGSDNGLLGIEFGTKFAVNYGGGLKIENLAGPMGFRVDARGYRAVDIFNQGLNIFEVSAGVMFTFGR